MDFQKIRSKFPKKSRLIKELAILVWVQLLVVGPNHARFLRATNSIETPPLQAIQATKSEILKDSSISYRAEGGFTGVKSFSVIISCVRGKVSILKTIRDPRSGLKNQVHRQTKTMTREKYVKLWKCLKRQCILTVPDAPDPEIDILDEFTFKFEARVGKQKNNFKIYGMSRPGASRYFALKNIIDKAADMASFWSYHESLARR